MSRIMNTLPTHLIVYLILLLGTVYPSKANLFPDTFKRAHRSTVRHTHSLGRDLRVAFGGILASRDTSTPSIVKRTLATCQPGLVLGGGKGDGPGQGGTGENTSPASPTSSSAVSGSDTVSSSPSSTSSASGSSSTGLSSPWKLQQTYAGSSFFDGWTFFIGSDSDLTHGIVDYVDEATARGNNLLEINDQGNAVMRVETTPTVVGNRQSIRITTDFQFNGALIIMDSVHIPTGCGTWPAFWTTNPSNWPAGGEIDIVEGVHNYTNNQATLHTSTGCMLSSSNQQTLSISGNVIGGTDCATNTTGNQGCGIRASSSNSFGAGFNDIGGGTYAMKWDTTGITIYFFPRGSEPADITNLSPQPDSWGTPQARWPASTCNPFQFFTNHNAIFDTTLCGDWAGAVWSTAGIPGQDTSCQQRTGFPTCEAFVRANGASFNEAYWEVKSVHIYQLQS